MRLIVSAFIGSAAASPLALLVGTTSACPDGFIEREGSEETSCYKQIVAGRGVGVGYTHAECSRECAKHKSALVCIDSDQELEWISETFPADHSCCFPGFGKSAGPFDTSCCMFIGLYQGDSATDTSKVESADAWKHWSSGCDAGYRHWFPGEPNDFAGFDENCAFYGMPFAEGFGQRGAWFDIGCESRLGCLCEGPANSTAAYLDYSHTARFKGYDAPDAPDMFAKIDTDGDGKLTGDEIAERIGEWQAGHLMHKFDTDGNGGLDRGEAESAYEYMQRHREKGDFKHIDREWHYQSTSACPDGFIEREGSEETSCYKQIVAGRGVGVGYTHAECSRECAKHKSALVCIDSDQELEWISETFPADHSCCFPGFGKSAGPFDTSCCMFIGLYQGDSATDTSKVESADAWKHWSSGCDAGYRHWFPGEPNDFAGFDENCAFYGMPFAEGFGQRGAWFDIGCESRLGCLCEGPANSTAAYLDYSHTARFKGYDAPDAPDMFAKIDTDGDGKLTGDEIAERIGEWQAGHLMHKFDTDGNGGLDRGEAESAYEYMQRHREKGDFKHIDREWHYQSHYRDEGRDSKGIHRDGGGVPWWATMMLMGMSGTLVFLITERNRYRRQGAGIDGQQMGVIQPTVMATPVAASLQGGGSAVNAAVTASPYQPPQQGAVVNNPPNHTMNAALLRNQPNSPNL